MFIRQRYEKEGEWLNESGLSVYLLENVVDIQTSEINRGIQVELRFSFFQPLRPLNNLDSLKFIFTIIHTTR